MKLFVLLALLVGMRVNAECVSVKIHVLEGKTSTLVVGKQLSFAYNSSTPCIDTGSAIVTDKLGVATVSLPIDTRFYVTVSDQKFGMRLCDESYIEVKKIDSTGVVSGSRCSKANAHASPGELILFVRPLSVFEWLHATLVGP